MGKRKYAKARIAELEDLYTYSEYDEELFRDILYELSFRSSKGAYALREEIMECLDAPSTPIFVGGEKVNKSSADTKNATPNKPVVAKGNFDFLADILG